MCARVFLNAIGYRLLLPFRFAVLALCPFSNLPGKLGYEIDFLCGGDVRRPIVHSLIPHLSHPPFDSPVSYIFFSYLLIGVGGMGYEKIKTTSDHQSSERTDLSSNHSTG
ncbi:hypothetical protein V8C34DRAFT_266489 [Trichoderma compactum]